MKNELKINGFSAVAEDELLDVDGGSISVGAAIFIGVCVVTAIVVTGSSTSTKR